jgi:hypothetical protein
MIEVIQADIYAAKVYLKGEGPWRLDEIGIGPDDPLVQAFARHREAQTNALRAVAVALIADVHRRYPNEKLRCEYMIALDAALEQSK